MPLHRKTLSVTRGQGVLEWLDEACHDFRERIAIEWRGTEISYGGLDDSANKVANCLIANKVVADSIVVVILDDRIRSIETMVGIFRSGAVFVPLDPDSPDERLGHLLKELSPVACILEDHYGERVARLLSQLQIACKVIDRTETYSKERPTVEVDPEAMRYIYYTSGSTGQPKGIVGRLSAISHFIAWEIS
jgi:acyl-CoA synthetase (AMP-forming)/AMP-acid ligase II